MRLILGIWIDGLVEKGLTACCHRHDPPKSPLKRGTLKKFRFPLFKGVRGIGDGWIGQLMPFKPSSKTFLIRHP
jgi:hypothetical protein